MTTEDKRKILEEAGCWFQEIDNSTWLSIKDKNDRTLSVGPMDKRSSVIDSAHTAYVLLNVFDLVEALQWFVDDENDAGGKSFVNFQTGEMYDSAEAMLTAFNDVKRSLGMEPYAQ